MCLKRTECISAHCNQCLVFSVVPPVSVWPAEREGGRGQNSGGFGYSGCPYICFHILFKLGVVVRRDPQANLFLEPHSASLQPQVLES